MNNVVMAGLISNLLILPFGAQALTLSDDFELALTGELVSDYRSRGQSQTLNDPALQLGATLTHSTGLYGMVWTSNVDFGMGSKTRQEIDYLAGYYMAITENVGLDIGYAKYVYSKQGNLNYGETYAVLNAYGFKLGTQYSDDFAGSQAYMWNWISYDMVLPADVGLGLHFGNVDYKDDLLISRSGETRQNYNEWSVKLSKNVLTLDWSVSYVDTDINESECSSLLGYDDVCSPTLVFGVKKTF
ncbi:putative bacterial protein [compost metagenome]